MKLLVAARGRSGQQVVNCACACHCLATKHNENFPPKIADRKATQLPAPRQRTLPSRPGKGNKSALQLFSTVRFDDETYKLQSDAHLRQTMLRCANDGQRSTDYSLRYYSPCLRAFLATADNASSSFCKRQLGLRGNNSVHAGSFHLPLGCALDKPTGNIANVVLIG